MPIELDKLAAQSRDLLRKLPPRRLALLVGAAVATLALAGYLALRSPGESYTVLFSGLAPEDAGKVLDNLRAQSVPFRIDNNGATIEVPSAKVHELRIGLASAGLPRGGGVGFEVFDKQAFGTTSFVEQMNYRRALQGELARTIMSLESVERARVLVAMKERSIYSTEDEPPSASVVLQLHAGRSLNASQVKGIVHLVAASVEGMKPERVTLVDESGVVLWTGDEGAEGRDEGDGHRELERTLARRVTEIVERVVGPGHAAVAVTAEMDTQRVERTEDLYDKGKEALRSEQRSEERVDGSDPTSAGGVAGARGNLPGAPAPTPGGTSATGRTRLAETRNYEVSHIVSHTVNPKARVRKLHVAVLLDGVGGQPRAQAELDRIASLSREAAGLDTDRGDRIEVHSAPFAPRPDVAGAGAPLSAWMGSPLVKYGALAVAALLALLIVSRAVRRRPGDDDDERASQPLMPVLPAPVAELEAAIKGEVVESASAPELAPRSARERALDAIRADSARAANVIAHWLAEPTDTPPPGATP